MIERRVIVVNGMTGQEMPVKLTEGATAGDILAKLGFGDANLARVSDRRVLPERGDISKELQDGDRLFAFGKMQVGGATWRA